MLITRRQLLVHATATAALLSDALNRHIPGWDACAQTVDDWDRGAVFHVLPTVSHERVLVKLSLTDAQSGAPALTVGGRQITGARTDSRGFFWEFDIRDLAPGRPYRLELRSDRGRALAEPWTISTFPDPGSAVDHVRVAFFTCAGGHDALLPNDVTQPPAVRRALLERAVAEKPDAIVANGDHVYWDLLAPGGGLVRREPRRDRLRGQVRPVGGGPGVGERGLSAQGGGRADCAALSDIVPVDSRLLYPRRPRLFRQRHRLRSAHHISALRCHDAPRAGHPAAVLP